MTEKKPTIAALKRKIQRLEAQLEALQEFSRRDRESEYQTVRRNADMAIRMKQAAAILLGEDEA